MLSVCSDKDRIIHDLTAQNSKYKVNYTTASQRIGVLEKELTESSVQIAAQQERAVTDAREKASQILELQNDAADLRGQLDIKNDRITAKDLLIARVNDDLSRAQSEATGHAQARDAATARVADLSEQVASLTAANHALSCRLDEQNSEHTNAILREGDKAEKQSPREGFLRSNISSFQGVIRDQFERIAALGKGNAMMEKAMRGLEVQNMGLQARLQNLQGFVQHTPLPASEFNTLVEEITSQDLLAESPSQSPLLTAQRAIIEVLLSGDNMVPYSQAESQFACLLPYAHRYPDVARRAALCLTREARGFKDLLNLCRRHIIRRRPCLPGSQWRHWSNRCTKILGRYYHGLVPFMKLLNWKIPRHHSVSPPISR
jgi:hypothetical protein